MNVVLNFTSFKDVRNFLQINNKCHETVKMLKVNPLLNSGSSIKQFCRLFQPNTINLMNFCILEMDLFSNEMKQLLPKIKSFDLYSENEKYIAFFIQHADLFQNIQRIRGDLSCIIQFLKNFSQNGQQRNVIFPKTIVIDTVDGSPIFFFLKSVMHKINTLKSYIPDLNETRVYFCFLNHARESEKEMLKELQGMHYYYYFITNEQCNVMNENLAIENNEILLRSVHYPNTINVILEKGYCNKCIIDSMQNFCYDKSTWIIPSFVTKLDIINSEVSHWKLPKILNNVLFDMKYIVKITLIRTGNIMFCNDFISLKKLKLTSCHSLTFKQHETSTYSLDMLKVLHLRLCSEIHICLTGTKLSSLLIEKCEKSIIEGNIHDIKTLHISFSHKLQLPEVSFENKLVFIEESTISFNDKSPMNFMNITYPEFLQLISSVIVLPSSINYKEPLLYSVRKLTTFSNQIRVQGNSLFNKNQLPLEPKVQFISNGFYNGFKSENLMINSNGKQIVLPAIIHYFEVKVKGYADFSIGLFDSDKYRILNHKNRHLGWDNHSIGLFSRHSSLYINGDKNKNYGKIFGNENETHVIGCAYNTLTKQAFYVLDGVEMNPFDIIWNNISAGLTILDLEELCINYGETPFVFDLEKAIRKHL
ncbi:B30.2/SPRY domain-containing protein [Entamoeba marina]